ncbi:MAG: lamin tail domain-containing protein [Chloroflexia bacterium]
MRHIVGRWSLLILLVCAVVALGVSFVSGSENTYPDLIANGGFEDGRAPWSRSSSTGAFEVTNDRPHTGSAAAQLTAPSSSLVTVSQTVSASRGASYRLTAYTLFNDPAYTRVRVSLRWIRSAPSTPRHFPAEPGADWRELSTDWIEPPSGTTRIEIVLSAETGADAPSGPVLFDDVALYEQPPPHLLHPPPQTASSRLRNEALSRPAEVDWNGDGRVDGGDEWVELYAEEEADLQDWWIADESGRRYVFRALRMVARSHFQLLSSETALILNDSGDVVRLHRPDGTLADELVLPPLDRDATVSRYPDGAREVTTEFLPTPREENGSRGRIPTPTPEPTSTPIPTNTPEPTNTPDLQHS